MNEYRLSRERLFGLLIECPYTKSHPECPLDDYRAGDLQGRVRVALKTMSESEMQDILERHDDCSACRDVGLRLSELM